MSTYFAGVVSRTVVSSLNALKLLPAKELTSTHTRQGPKHKIFTLFCTPDDAVKAALVQEPRDALYGVQLVHMHLSPDTKEPALKHLLLSPDPRTRERLGPLTYNFAAHDVKDLDVIFKGDFKLDCIEAEEASIRVLGISTWEPNIGMKGLLRVDEPMPGISPRKLGC